MLDIVKGLLQPTLQSVITLVGFLALTYLALVGRLGTEPYLALVGPIVGYWFKGQADAFKNGKPPAP